MMMMMMCSVLLGRCTSSSLPHIAIFTSLTLYWYIVYGPFSTFWCLKQPSAIGAGQCISHVICFCSYHSSLFNLLRLFCKWPCFYVLRAGSTTWYQNFYLYPENGLLSQLTGTMAVVGFVFNHKISYVILFMLSEILHVLLTTNDALVNFF